MAGYSILSLSDIIAEKGEEVLVDANVPHGSWKLTGEDFGE